MRIFHGVELERKYITDADKGKYDYIGQDCDAKGEVWDIIMNINTGIRYYTVIGGTNMNDKLFKFILKCQKNYNKPDLHSFSVNTDKGMAFIDCRQHEVYVEYYINNCKKQWCGLAVAAANLLSDLRADVNTIDM